MKSEQLAEFAKLVDGPGNCGEHRTAIAALLQYTHDLECRVEILKDQADAKNDLRKALHDADLQIGELVAALEHMKGCRSCGEDQWEICEGGRAALAAMEKATVKRKCEHEWIDGGHDDHGPVDFCRKCGIAGRQA